MQTGAHEAARGTDWPVPSKMTLALTAKDIGKSLNCCRRLVSRNDEIRRQALTDYCQVLFGLNEFIYVD